MPGKNKKQPPTHQTSPQLPTPAPTTPLESPQHKPRWDRSDTISVIALVFSFASAVFAGFAWNESVTANNLTKISQDRGSGKVQALFDIVSDNLGKPATPSRFIRKKDGYEENVFRVESVDELMAWSPRVRIKNTGSEPIDVIKVDVTHLECEKYGVGVKQIFPLPRYFYDSTNYELTSFGKLMPGQLADIVFTPLVLSLMTRHDWKDFPDKDRKSTCRVEVLCRLVGSQSYDQMPRDKLRLVEFHWRPAGFEQNAKYVKECLEIKPHVVISDDKSSAAKPSK
ncbi:hypothetical protein [Gemmata sp.]|uniref:hypothetical protein n=1 Tax=Gemmata sp. TaxID=1914242 RepID=UPI003F71A5AE